MGTGAPAGSIRAARMVQGIPIVIVTKPLPVFMLSTSVSEVLVRKPTAITMADDTFTGKALRRSTDFASSVALHSMSGCTNPGGGSYLRVSASRADTLDFGAMSASCSDDIMIQVRAFTRCLSDSAAIRKECLRTTRSGGDPQMNKKSQVTPKPEPPWQVPI